MKQKVENISYRKTEIADRFLSELDKHLGDLKEGRIETNDIVSTNNFVYINMLLLPPIF